jgi:hypothetical protein
MTSSAAEGVGFDRRRKEAINLLDIYPDLIQNWLHQYVLTIPMLISEERCCCAMAKAIARLEVPIREYLAAIRRSERWLMAIGRGDLANHHILGLSLMDSDSNSECTITNADGRSSTSSSASPLFRDSPSVPPILGHPDLPLPGHDIHQAALIHLCVQEANSSGSFAGRRPFRFGRGSSSSGPLRSRLPTHPIEISSDEDDA